MADMDVLRAQHSVYYSTSTSEIKDDYAALVACLKTGVGVLSRQEASFLLWHHVLLNHPDRLREVVAAGLVGACMAVLEAAECTTAQKSSAAGLLLAAVSSGKEAKDDLVKARCMLNTAVMVLHSYLYLDTQRLVQQYAAQILGTLAEDVGTRAAFVKLLEDERHRVPFTAYAELLHHKALPPVTLIAVARYVAALLAPDTPADLRQSAVECGMVESLLLLLRSNKSDRIVVPVLASLKGLSKNKRSWEHIEQAGGINVLVDMLGAPPAALLRYEAVRYMHVLDPAQYHAHTQAAAISAAAMAAAAAAALADMELLESKSARTKNPAKARSQSQVAGSVATSGQFPAGALASRSSTTSGPTEPVRAAAAVAADVLNLSNGGAASNLHAVHLSLQLPSARSTGGGGTQVAPLSPTSAAAAAVAASDVVLPPAVDIDVTQLLSHNTLPVKWSQVSQPVRNAAAAVLYEMAPTYVAALESRLAATRLVIMLIDLVTEAKAGQKKTKKKSARLVLTAEQNAALVCVTGILRLLSTNNLNRYRIAQPAGAIESLIALYEGAADALIRANAQVLLTNAALVAENGTVLLDASIPEHFLVPVPLRLDADELTELTREYPGLTPAPAPPVAVNPHTLQEIERIANAMSTGVLSALQQPTLA